MVATGDMARARISDATTNDVTGAVLLRAAAAARGLAGAAAALSLLGLLGAGGAALLAVGSGAAGRVVSPGRSVRRGSTLAGAGGGTGFGAGTTSCGGAAASAGAAMPAACRAKRFTTAGSPLAAAAIAAMTSRLNTRSWRPAVALS